MPQADRRAHWDDRYSAAGSGLPVERYDADRLIAEIGPGFTDTGRGRFDHVSPSGATQPLTWVTARADAA